MEGRKSVGQDYRYGFNGQETEVEITNNNSHTSAEYWMYDARLGRRWNLDPLTNPNQSRYATFDNNPIYYADPNGAAPWHPEGVESSEDMKLVADEGDDENSLRDYLNTIGVDYSEDQIQDYFSQIQCRNESGEAIKGLGLYSNGGLFNNLVGKYLMSRMSEDLTWGNTYFPDVICGGPGWKCSPVSANRVGMAVEYVYGEDSEEYNRIGKNASDCGYIGYHQFQANFIPKRMYADGETGDEKYERLNASDCGLTYEQRLQAGCGAVEFANLGSIQNNIWSDLKPGAVVGLNVHSAIFTRYETDQNGTVLGLYYWDDHNCEQYMPRGGQGNMYGRAGANFD